MKRLFIAALLMVAAHTTYADVRPVLRDTTEDTGRVGRDTTEDAGIVGDDEDDDTTQI